MLYACSPVPNLQAVVVGCTGAVGAQVLGHLLISGHWQHVVALGEPSVRITQFVSLCLLASQTWNIGVILLVNVMKLPAETQQN
eukprot:1149979-Pelagomonas_calceolata.AAC.1